MDRSFRGNFHQSRIVKPKISKQVYNSDDQEKEYLHEKIATALSSDNGDPEVTVVRKTAAIDCFEGRVLVSTKQSGYGNNETHTPLYRIRI